MSSMTMLVQQVRWLDYGGRHVEARAILDTKEDMARQLIELLDNSMTIDPHSWNGMGNEWRVEDSYAEGCQWYEFTLETYKKLSKMYSNVPMPRWWGTNFTSQDSKVSWAGQDDWCVNIDDWDAQCEVNKIYGRLRQGLTAEQLEYADGETIGAQEFLQRLHNLGHFKSYYDEVKEFLLTKLPTKTNAVGFDTSYHSRQSYTHSSIDIQLIRLPSEFFNIPSRIGEVNETLREYSNRKDSEEYAKYLANYDTPEAKAEREAEAQKQRDLATFMGESGYTSFARNDDGTTTVWR